MLTWHEILGDLLQSKDKDAYFGCYLWHYYLGNSLKPARIGEIGFRYGYSLKAIAMGAKAAGVEVGLHGWDNEAYEPGCTQIVEDHFRKIDIPFTSHKLNMQKLKNLGVEFDFIHVDGDHSEAGAMHDMHLAWNALTANGYMLVDDLCEVPVHKACCRFMQDNNVQGTMMAMLIQKGQVYPDYIKKAWEV